MTKASLPEKAIQNLAEMLGITDPSLITDIKTNRVGDTYHLSVVLTTEISQTVLKGLIK